MNELKEQLLELKDRFDRAWEVIDMARKKAELLDLQGTMSDPDFWQDQKRAKQVSQTAADLEKEIKQWEKMHHDIVDTLEILEMDMADQEVSMREDIAGQLQIMEKTFRQMELALFLGDKYDTHSAIVSIHSGTGGTDAADWAEMLLRMYMRFAEKQGWATNISFISPAQEAGIKSVQFTVTGRYAYGYLKSEHGVHRLVRISPFDAEKMRHTSFAMVEVLPLIEDNLSVEIKPEELRIETFRSGGHGGQSVNTTDSAVRIVHIPTGIVVQCQNERSQAQNKDKALSFLQSKLQKYYETEAEEEKARLRGEYTEAAWGNQARSYVLHPYKLIKDHRTDFETSDVESVLDGDLMEFIESYLQYLQKKK